MRKVIFCQKENVADSKQGILIEVYLDLPLIKHILNEFLPTIFFIVIRYMAVYERISILVRIEYRILFASAKLSESNSKYYLCCKIYSNNIRIVQNIRIFEYFRIICNAKMKNFPK